MSKAGALSGLAAEKTMIDYINNKWATKEFRTSLHQLSLDVNQLIGLNASKGRCTDKVDFFVVAVLKTQESVTRLISQKSAKTDKTTGQLTRFWADYLRTFGLDSNLIAMLKKFTGEVNFVDRTHLKRKLFSTCSFVEQKWLVDSFTLNKI